MHPLLKNKITQTIMINRIIIFLHSQEAIELIGKYYFQEIHINQINKIIETSNTEEEAYARIIFYVTQKLLALEHEWPWFYDNYLRGKQFKFDISKF